MKIKIIHIVILAGALSVSLALSQKKPSPGDLTTNNIKSNVKIVDEKSFVSMKFQDMFQEQDELVRGRVNYIANNLIALGGGHTFTVKNKGIAILHAKNEIHLGPGFRVDEGGTFSATVDERPRKKSSAENKNASGDADLPTVYNLAQNFPNPFNPTTVIRYDLPRDVHVTIKVYDILGREALTLVNEYQYAGFKSIILDGNLLSSGVYFYRIQAGNFTDVKKMLFVK